VKAKAIVPREFANRDVDEAVEHYLKEGGESVAIGFIDALERAYQQIGRHPEAGSPRYAHELNLPDLRFLALGRYPHLIFYVERSDYIDVWRVLHGKRDIPAWLQESDTAMVGKVRAPNP
jgi:toxin ParE1/3/4